MFMLVISPHPCYIISLFQATFHSAHSNSNLGNVNRKREVSVMKDYLQAPYRGLFLCFVVSVFVQGGNGEDLGFGFGFVQKNGTKFVVNGKDFYVNGFNSYWMMYAASSGEAADRQKVSAVFQQAATHGLNVARTWAFNDGNSSRALQTSPGVYDERSFQALDFAVNEAKKNGIRMILSFVNNYENYGGRHQYVQWAKARGANASSDDDFYSDPITRSFYKNHVKKLLTRANRIRGTTYMEDPTIFAWELINEPRCQETNCGKKLQAWIEEMSAYVKSIDRNHLVEVGMEGFYGDSTPERAKIYNPGGYRVGSDFIANNQVESVDFASVHAYPDSWLPQADENAQHEFLIRWLESHIEDAANVLKKPVVFGEFGKSFKTSGYTEDQRVSVFSTVYDSIYSAARNGTGGGSLFWQILGEGMDSFSDGYEIHLSENTPVVDLISKQSRRLCALQQEAHKSWNIVPLFQFINR